MINNIVFLIIAFIVSHIMCHVYMDHKDFNKYLNIRYNQKIKLKSGSTNFIITICIGIIILLLIFSSSGDTDLSIYYPLIGCAIPIIYTIIKLICDIDKAGWINIFKFLVVISLLLLPFIIWWYYTFLYGLLTFFISIFVIYFLFIYKSNSNSNDYE